MKIILTALIIGCLCFVKYKVCEDLDKAFEEREGKELFSSEREKENLTIRSLSIINCAYSMLIIIYLFFFMASAVELIS